MVGVTDKGSQIVLDTWIRKVLVESTNKGTAEANWWKGNPVSMHMFRAMADAIVDTPLNEDAQRSVTMGLLHGIKIRNSRDGPGVLKVLVNMRLAEAGVYAIKQDDAKQDDAKQDDAKQDDAKQQDVALLRFAAGIASVGEESKLEMDLTTSENALMSADVLQENATKFALALTEENRKMTELERIEREDIHVGNAKNLEAWDAYAAHEWLAIESQILQEKLKELGPASTDYWADVEISNTYLALQEQDKKKAAQKEAAQKERDAVGKKRSGGNEEEDSDPKKHKHSSP
jgi:hypothetical protein